jgi:hypothetical protein
METYLNNHQKRRRWQWFTHAILATWEEKIRRIKIGDQPRQTVHEIPSHPLLQHSTPHLLSQAILEAEIRRTAEQKRWQDPI